MPIDLTQYGDTADVAFPGMLSDTSFTRKVSRENATGAAQLSGVFVAKHAALPETKVQSLAAASDAIAGIVLHAHTRDNVAGQSGWATGSELPVAELAPVYMVAEEAMLVGDPVYARFSANGGNTTIGAIRNDPDGGTCMLVKGARVTRGGVIPAVLFDLSVQEDRHTVEIPFAHAAIAATTTAFITKLKSDRQFVVDEVVYDNPTGFAQDPANTYKVEIKKATGPTSMAAWDTTTGQQGTLTADTPVSLVNAVLANRTATVAERLNLVITKTGAPANLPAGSGFIRGHYV